MTEAPRKRGRPAGSEGPRTAVIKLRVTPDEHARYSAAAEDLGSAGLSEWVREACEAFASDDPAVHPSARRLASGPRRGRMGA